MKDYDYVTLYLPYEGQLARQAGSRLISDEAIAWLNENVGTGTLHVREWLLGAEERKHEWCYQGTDYGPSSNFTKINRVFYFRDIDKATMFKLVWGG